MAEQIAGSLLRISGLGFAPLECKVLVNVGSEASGGSMFDFWVFVDRLVWSGPGLAPSMSSLVNWFLPVKSDPASQAHVGGWWCDAALLRFALLCLIVQRRHLGQR